MFTYCGSLRKHISDICVKRKERVRKGMALDHKWELGVKKLLKAKDLQTVVPDSGDEGEVEVRPRRRRGKRKNHKWGSNKKRRSETNSPVITAVDNKGPCDSFVIKGQLVDKEQNSEPSISASQHDSDRNSLGNQADQGIGDAYLNKESQVKSPMSVNEKDRSSQDILSREGTNDLKGFLDKENLVNDRSPTVGKGVGIDLGQGQMQEKCYPGKSPTKVQKKSKAELLNTISKVEEVIMKKTLNSKWEQKPLAKKPAEEHLSEAISRPENQLLSQSNSLSQASNVANITKSTRIEKDPEHCKVLEPGSSEVEQFNHPELNVRDVSKDTRINESDSQTKMYTDSENVLCQIASLPYFKSEIKASNFMRAGVLKSMMPEMKSGVMHGSKPEPGFQTAQAPKPITKDVNILKVSGGDVHAVALDFCNKTRMDENKGTVRLDESKSQTLIMKSHKTCHSQSTRKPIDISLSVPDPQMKMTQEPPQDYIDNHGALKAAVPHVSCVQFGKPGACPVQLTKNTVSDSIHNQTLHLAEGGNFQGSKGVYCERKNNLAKKLSAGNASKSLPFPVSYSSVAKPVLSSVSSISSSSSSMLTTQQQNPGIPSKSDMFRAPKNDPLVMKKTLSAASHPLSTMTQKPAVFHPLRTTAQTPVSVLSPPASSSAVKKSPTGSHPSIITHGSIFTNKTSQLEKVKCITEVQSDQQDTLPGKKCKILTRNKTVQQILLERASGEVPTGLVPPDKTTSQVVVQSNKKERSGGSAIGVGSGPCAKLDTAGKCKPGKKRTVSALLHNMSCDKPAKCPVGSSGISDSAVAMVQQTVFTGESVSKVITPVTNSVAKTVMSDNQVAIVQQTVFTGDSVSKIITPVSNTVWKQPALPKPTVDTLAMPSQNVSQTVLYVQSVVPGNSTLCNNSNVISFNKVDVGKITNVLNVQNVSTTQVKTSRKMNIGVPDSRIKSIAIPKADSVELGSLTSSDAQNKTQGNAQKEIVDSNWLTNVGSKNVGRHVFSKVTDIRNVAGAVSTTGISTTDAKLFTQSNFNFDTNSMTETGKGRPRSQGSSSPMAKSLTSSKIIRDRIVSAETTKARGKPKFPPNLLPTSDPSATSSNKPVLERRKTKPKASQKVSSSNKKFVKRNLPVSHGDYYTSMISASVDTDDSDYDDEVIIAKRPMGIINPLETLAEVATMELSAVQDKRKNLTDPLSHSAGAEIAKVSYKNPALSPEAKTKHYKPGMVSKNAFHNIASQMSAINASGNNGNKMGFKGKGKKTTPKLSRKKSNPENSGRGHIAASGDRTPPVKKSRKNNWQTESPTNEMLPANAECADKKIPVNEKKDTSSPKTGKGRSVISPGKVNKAINQLVDLNTDEKTQQITIKNLKQMKQFGKRGRGRGSGAVSVGVRGEARTSGGYGTAQGKQELFERGGRGVKRSPFVTRKGRGRGCAGNIDNQNRSIKKIDKRSVSERGKRKLSMNFGNLEQGNGKRTASTNKQEPLKMTGMVTRKSSPRSKSPANH